MVAHFKFDFMLHCFILLKNNVDLKQVFRSFSQKFLFSLYVKNMAAVLTVPLFRCACEWKLTAFSTQSVLLCLGCRGAGWDVQPEKLDFSHFHRKHLRGTPKHLPHIDREGWAPDSVSEFPWSQIVISLNPVHWVPLFLLSAVFQDEQVWGRWRYRPERHRKVPAASPFCKSQILLFVILNAYTYCTTMEALHILPNQLFKKKCKLDNELQPDSFSIKHEWIYVREWPLVE